MKYTVAGRVCAFGAGQKLKLSPDQIDARRHALEVVDEKSGKVITKTEVQFKSGETIDLDQAEGELPSSLAAVLTVGSASKGKSGKVKAAKKAETEQDLDEIEAALEAAEDALSAAIEKHGLVGIDSDTYTDEQKALVADELEGLKKAKSAFDAAIGD